MHRNLSEIVIIPYLTFPAKYATRPSAIPALIAV